MNLFLAAASGKDPREGIEIAMALRVHGGVSFCDDHIWMPGDEPEGFWWFGFDCGHYNDLSPWMLKLFEENGKADFPDWFRGVYRDQQYVVSECQQLAAQLVRIAEQSELVLQW